MSVDNTKLEYLNLLERQKKIRMARDEMVPFCEFMMPDTSDIDNPLKTEYQVSAPARCLCTIVEEVEKGYKKRVAVSMPPQHGKTVNLSTFGVAWIWGRNPKARIVVVSYNQDRAESLGLQLKDVIKTKQYSQVFPQLVLEDKAQSRSYLQNTEGGSVTFAGIGGSITGRTADYFIIDDPIKGEDDESDLTPTSLERLWKWFFKVAYSRGSKTTRIVITHTRWSEDDLIGRLCDPNHPDRKKRFEGIAEDWFYLNLPGVVTDPTLAKLLGLKLRVQTHKTVLKQFGDQPMSPLWEASKDLLFFAEWKRGDSRTFSALVMGQPSPEDGDYFKKSDFVTYSSRAELPVGMVNYGASDHALSLKRDRDPTVLGCMGVDENDDIWIYPELIWKKMETNDTVDAMISCMREKKPLIWWPEDDNIMKSIGPFLFKRMQEEKMYTTRVDPIRPMVDKKARARAIQGRIQMRKVHFPAFAPWWADAMAQMLRFPNGAHDDFVDFLALFGLGLLKLNTGENSATEESTNIITVGSMEWILADTRRKAEKEKHKDRRGW